MLATSEVSLRQLLTNSSVSLKVALVYLNPKLLLADPFLLATVSLDKPLISELDMAEGNFMTIKLDDCWPVPDEWTLKEGNEKDLGSCLFSYSIGVCVPTETGDRLAIVGGGSLTSADIPVSNNGIFN